MINVNGLVVRFGENLAVNDLNLSIEEGTLYGLLGPNGAGKSTTISCIAGLRRPSAGSISLAGIDVQAQPAAVKRLLGVVPQKLALYRELSVLENLRIFGGLMRLSGRQLSERVAWGLALAQLDDQHQARVETLSGGMQRRLNMACSLLHDPKVIICDEPTAGVDPQSRNHLFETVKALHAEGRTVVYTTHYMEEVETLCERVAIIDRGQVIAEDTLTALLGPTDAREYLLRTSRPLPVDQISDMLGEGLIAVEPRGRSLEDVFLDLTGRALRDRA